MQALARLQAAYEQHRLNESRVQEEVRKAKESYESLLKVCVPIRRCFSTDLHIVSYYMRHVNIHSRPTLPLLSWITFKCLPPVMLRQPLVVSVAEAQGSASGA